MRKHTKITKMFTFWCFSVVTGAKNWFWGEKMGPNLRLSPLMQIWPFLGHGRQSNMKTNDIFALAFDLRIQNIYNFSRFEAPIGPKNASTFTQKSWKSLYGLFRRISSYGYSFLSQMWVYGTAEGCKFSKMFTFTAFYGVSGAKFAILGGQFSQNCVFRIFGRASGLFCLGLDYFFNFVHFFQMFRLGLDPSYPLLPWTGPIPIQMHY